MSTTQTESRTRKIILSTYDSGWEWSIPAADRGYYRPEPGSSRISYRTNAQGEGLWVWQSSGTWDTGSNCAVYEWKQIGGTAQFSLGHSRSAAYSAIARYFADDIELALSLKENSPCAA